MHSPQIFSECCKTNNNLNEGQKINIHESSNISILDLNRWSCCPHKVNTAHSENWQSAVHHIWPLLITCLLGSLSVSSYERQYTKLLTAELATFERQNHRVCQRNSHPGWGETKIQHHLVTKRDMLERASTAVDCHWSYLRSQMDWAGCSGGRRI